MQDLKILILKIRDNILHEFETNEYWSKKEVLAKKVMKK